MQVKTREFEEKINDLETNHLFTIPEEIKNKVNERGFYLYNWIGEKDVKNSLERDFLKNIDRFGIVFAFLIIIPGALAFFMGGYFLSGIIFFSILFLINLFLVFQLIFISLKRSSILRKNAYVVLTDDYISINGEIKKKTGLNSNDIKEINKVASIFEEEIFKPSNIENTKKGLTKSVGQKFANGFSKILSVGKGNSKNSGQLVLILILLYLAYAFSLFLIYIFGIFIVWIFGNILNIINKKILLIKGHKITRINTGFEDLGDYSNSLTNEKDNLTKLLNEAINNDWQDSLLTNINKKLELINKFAGESIESNIELKKDIESSEFKEMFNYATYNSWIKNQILLPLEQIKTLLLKNLEILNKQDKDIDDQLKNESDPSKSGPILASKKRVEMRIEEINIHISKMDLYINKLK
ncbi:MAG: hypothetical protein PHV23_01765 [Candidatus Gracilibacteria bacterium]|nr:hypothetical protein [Candidatus Gracilibacteria bacterium]